MSSAHHPVELAPEPSSNRLLVSAAAWVGVLGIIFAIFGIAFIYTRAEGPVDQQVTQRRMAIRQEVEAREMAAVSGYSASPAGVRIPVSRAMELVLPQLNAKQVGPAPAAEQDAQPQPAAGPEQPATATQADHAAAAGVQAAPAPQDQGAERSAGQPAQPAEGEAVDAQAAPPAGQETQAR